MRISRLFRKTLFFTLIVIGLAANLSSVVYGVFIYRQLTDEFTSKAESIAGSLARSDIELILEGDAAAIQSRIEQYAGIEGVSYVAVANERGEVIAHTFAPVIPQVVSDLIAQQATRAHTMNEAGVRRLELPGQGEVIHVGRPILHGEAGSVYIGMDRSIIMDSIWSAVLTLQGLMLALLAVSVVVGYIFMERISRPLHALAEYAKQVARHDFSGTVEVTSDDEVGALAGSMRSMAKDLSGLIAGLEDEIQSATAELQESLGYQQAIISSMADGLLVVDSRGRVVKCNTALLHIFGLSEEDVLNEDVSDLFGPDIGLLVTSPEEFSQELTVERDAEGAITFAGQAGEQRSRGHSVETRGKRSDGTVFPLELSVTELQLEGAHLSVSLLRDITRRKKAEDELKDAYDELEDRVEDRTRELSRANAQLKLENAERRMIEGALRRTEEKYRSIFENAVEGIFQSSPGGRLLNANPALVRIFGYKSPDEFIESVGDVSADLYVDAERRVEFLRLMQEHGEVIDFEAQVRRRDGEIIWVSENARLVRDSHGETLYFEGSVEDITLRKAAEEQLKRQAYHDSLTGLPNRVLFLDRLHMAMERSHRNKGYFYAVLYLDLDRFKVINDSLGHDVGDMLLKMTARILEKCVRSMDTVARFGGDEFAVLLEEMSAPREAVKISRRILEELTQPLELAGHEVFTSASIGIVLATKDYTRPEAVFRDADTAMYRAKESGRGRFKVFNQRMHNQALELMRTETELRRSMERMDFEVRYLPVAWLESRELVGFEALVRWRHPERGLTLPDAFISLAEDTGLIVSIGEFVMRDAVAMAGRWSEANPGFCPSGAGIGRLCVNLSLRELLQPAIAKSMGRLLEAAELAPECLSIEVPEMIFMQRATEVREVLERFKELGVTVFVDDFGTGYSSLNYLKTFPVDGVKIDRSLVAAAEEEQEARAVLESVVHLGGLLQLTMVAEGVASEKQRTMLLGMGCRLGQGFVLSPPVEAEEARQMALQGAVHNAGKE